MAERQEWWPSYIDSVAGVAEYCRRVEIEPHNAEMPGVVALARTVAEMLETLTALVDRCLCCRVPLGEHEARAQVISPTTESSLYCTGCWSDIEAAINAQVDLMMRSLM